MEAREIILEMNRMFQQYEREGRVKYYGDSDVSLLGFMVFEGVFEDFKHWLIYSNETSLGSLKPIQFLVSEGKTYERSYDMRKLLMDKLLDKIGLLVKPDKKAPIGDNLESF